MANRQPQRQTLAAAVFPACLTMSIAAQAQEADADAQPAASEDQPTTLATMTVTAQKREEALQRSEERREGKECVSTGCARGMPDHQKKQKSRVSYKTHLSGRHQITNQ